VKVNENLNEFYSFNRKLCQCERKMRENFTAARAKVVGVNEQKVVGKLSNTPGRERKSQIRERIERVERAESRKCCAIHENMRNENKITNTHAEK
jgi:hypothetical protein